MTKLSFRLSLGIFGGIALLAVVMGCGVRPDPTPSIPIRAESEADKERLIREDRQLTPAQKQIELAKLRAAKSR